MSYKMKKRPLGDVGFDMTPMIDCVFQLLIFFMVTTVFKNPAQLDLKLPIAQQPDQLEKMQVVVELSEEGRLAVAGAETSWDSLDAFIITEKQKKNTNTVLIKADENSKHGDVLKIMTIARSVEVEVLDLAVDTKVEE